MRTIAIMFCLLIGGCTSHKEILYAPCLGVGTTTEILGDNILPSSYDEVENRFICAPSAVSSLKHSTVICNLYSFSEGGLSAFFIIVLEESYNQPVDFTLNDIQLLDVNLNSINWYSPDDFIAKLKKERDSELMMMAIASGLSSYVASHSYSSTTTYHEGTLYSSYGNSYHYSGDSRSYTTHYDPAAARAVQMDNLNLMTMVDKDYKGKIQDYRKWLLRASSLAPGGSAIGIVQFKKHGGPWHKIIVNIAGDIHCIIFHDSETGCFPAPMVQRTQEILDGLDHLQPAIEK